MAPEKTIISAWIARDLRDQLAQLADAGDRSISAEVRRPLVRHLEAKAGDETREPVAAR